MAVSACRRMRARSWSGGSTACSSTRRSRSGCAARMAGAFAAAVTAGREACLAGPMPERDSAQGEHARGRHAVLASGCGASRMSIATPPPSIDRDTFWPPADELLEAADAIRARLARELAGEREALAFLPEFSGPVRPGRCARADRCEAASRRGAGLARRGRRDHRAAPERVELREGTRVRAWSGKRSDDWLAALAAFAACDFDLHDALTLALAWRGRADGWYVGIARHGRRCPASRSHTVGLRRQWPPRRRRGGRGGPKKRRKHIHRSARRPADPDTELADRPLGLSEDRSLREFAFTFPPCPRPARPLSRRGRRPTGSNGCSNSACARSNCAASRPTARCSTPRSRVLCGPARAHDARLFINDHWRRAIDAGAYGVHLGQEDLQHADLEAIAPGRPAWPVDARFS